jgi:hypothetical protein
LAEKINKNNFGYEKGSEKLTEPWYFTHYWKNGDDNNEVQMLFKNQKTSKNCYNNCPLHGSW